MLNLLQGSDEKFLSNITQQVIKQERIFSPPLLDIFINDLLLKSINFDIKFSQTCVHMLMI